MLGGIRMDSLLKVQHSSAYSNVDTTRVLYMMKLIILSSDLEEYGMFQRFKGYSYTSGISKVYCYTLAVSAPS